MEWNTSHTNEMILKQQETPSIIKQGPRRRLVFESPKERRKPKSIEILRAKRKRYRWRKKDILRWKHRKEDYEKGIEEDAREMNRKELEAEEQKRKKHEAEQEKHKEYLKDLEPKYVGIQTEMESSDAGALLLESILLPDNNQEKEFLTGIDRVSAERRIILLQEERNKALKTARHYRNVAEECKKKNRELKTNTAKKVETVRDFWRNKIMEAQTRSRRMVLKAMSRK